ncbi:hypothetical protein H6503_00425 [Candidatus Woesearchaeota archaeon]|nr:hypothetical protein [Candidatus Woesearchaeota archaeon]
MRKIILLMILIFILSITTYAQEAAEGVDGWSDMTADERADAAKSDPASLSPEQMQDVWPELTPSERLDILEQEPSHFGSLDRTQQEDIMEDPTVVDKCTSCVKDYLDGSTDLASEFSDPAKEETFKKYFSDSMNLMSNAIQANAFLESRIPGDINVETEVFGTEFVSGFIEYDPATDTLVVGMDMYGNKATNIDLKSLTSATGITNLKVVGCDGNMCTPEPTVVMETTYNEPFTFKGSGDVSFQETENGGMSLIRGNGADQTTVDVPREYQPGDKVTIDGVTYDVDFYAPIDFSSMTEEQINDFIGVGLIPVDDNLGDPVDPNTPPDGTQCQGNQIPDPDNPGSCLSPPATVDNPTGDNTDPWINFDVDNSIDGYGRMTIDKGYYNVNSLGGEFSIYSNFISMENGYLYDKGSDTLLYGNIYADYDDNNDLDYAFIQSPGPGQSAGFNHPDGMFRLRGGLGASIEVDFDDGSITEIATNDNGGVAAIEGEFKSSNDMNYYDNYVRSSSLISFTDSSSSQIAPITAAAISTHNLNPTSYVTNVTLRSRNAQYIYRPAKYKVSSSEYGDFEDKIICFRNCATLDIDNSVYVRSDDLGIISVGKLGGIVINYEGNSREVFDPNYLLLTKDSSDEYTSNFNTILNKEIDSSQEQDLLFRLNREAKRNLSVRESLETHKQLYYQNAEPASFADMNDKIVFVDPDTEGFTELNFFTYIRDGQRKLVLNRDSYNNMIELNAREDIAIPVDTFVLVDGKISYNIERDLSIQPEVYGNTIFFKNPDEVKNDYGEIIN